MSVVSEAREMFVAVGTKIVSGTDISKQAYVVNESQREVLRRANIFPSHDNIFHVKVLLTGETLAATYYGSRRDGSGRQPEYRMGRFVNWLNPGDYLLLATDGNEVFVHKITTDDDLVFDGSRPTPVTRVLRHTPFECLRKRILRAAPTQRVSVTRQEFARNPAVREMVLRRCAFKCEMPDCTYSSFLKDDGESYIEVHHLKQLADGGEDTVANASGVCPNCHRKLHFSKDRTRLCEQLQQVVIRENQRLSI